MKIFWHRSVNAVHFIQFFCEFHNIIFPYLLIFRFYFVKYFSIYNAYSWKSQHNLENEQIWKTHRYKRNIARVHEQISLKINPFQLGRAFLQNLKIVLVIITTPREHILFHNPPIDPSAINRPLETGARSHRRKRASRVDNGGADQPPSVWNDRNSKPDSPRCRSLKTGFNSRELYQDFWHFRDSAPPRT